MGAYENYFELGNALKHTPSHCKSIIQQRELGEASMAEAEARATSDEYGSPSSEGVKMNKEGKRKVYIYAPARPFNKGHRK